MAAGRPKTHDQIRRRRESTRAKFAKFIAVKVIQAPDAIVAGQAIPCAAK